MPVNRFATAGLCLAIALQGAVYGGAIAAAAVEPGAGISSAMTITAPFPDTPRQVDGDQTRHFPGTDGDPSVALEITAQAFSLSPGSELWIDALVRFADGRPISDTPALAVSVSPPVQSLAALRSLLEDPDGVKFREVARLPIETPPPPAGTPGAPTSSAVTFRATVNAEAYGRSVVSFPATGVYLVRLSLRDGSRADRTLGGAETFVEFSFSRAPSPLYTAVVAPFAAPPLTGPLSVNGELGPDTSPPSGEIERLVRLGRDYEAGGDFPLSLAIQPSTLSDLAVAAEAGDTGAEQALSSMARSARSPNGELISLPFSVLPTLFYSSPQLHRDLSSEWELGQSVLDAFTERTVTTEVALPPLGGFDREALDRAGESGFGSAILHSTDYSGEGPPSKIQPVLAESSGGALTTYPVFDEVSPALSALDSKRLRLSPAAVAATLVVMAIESPSPRGALLLPPYTWNPEPGGLSALLSMLGQTQWIRPVRLTELLENVPLALRSRRARAIAQVRPTAPQSQPTGPTAALEDASIAVAGLESMAGAGSPLGTVARTAFAQAPSAALAADPASVDGDAVALTERAYRRVSQHVRDTAAKVSIPPATGITLTAQSSLIPLRIENPLAQPIEVAVNLQSDKLLFVQGERMSPVAVPPGGLTLNIPVEAVATGAFTLHVSLSSPDGRLILATRQLQIRFMRVGPLAIFLGLGALAVLALWWIRQTVSRRRPPRTPPSDDYPPA